MIKQGVLSPWTNQDKVTQSKTTTTIASEAHPPKHLQWETLSVDPWPIGLQMIDVN